MQCYEMFLTNENKIKYECSLIVELSFFLNCSI